MDFYGSLSGFMEFDGSFMEFSLICLIFFGYFLYVFFADIFTNKCSSSSSQKKEELKNH